MRGAAIGTLTARVLEFFIVAWYVLVHDKRLALRLRELFRRGGELARDYGKVALPIVLQGAMWGASNCLQTAILGHMNDNAVAAYSISSTIFLLLKVAAVGAATASSILIAKQIGANADDRARAQRALTAAQERLKNRDALTDEEIRLAEAKLRRALVRTSLTETA